MPVPYLYFSSFLLMSCVTVLYWLSWLYIDLSFFLIFISFVLSGSFLVIGLKYRQLNRTISL